MIVSISNNNGANWTLLEDVLENTGQWTKKSFRIADFVAPTSQVRLRFVARDTSPYNLASVYMAHAVIDPRDTRAFLKSRLAIHSRSTTNGVGQHHLANWPPMVV